jgi:small subunit ribosomal protein S13
MPRIAGVNIPDKKRIEIAITYIHGIGRTLNKKVLKEAGIDGNRKAGELTAEEVNRLKDIIEKSYKYEENLRREVSQNVRRLKDIGSWRGMRHARKLPVRGQRTKTNTRTVRGNTRKTVGSGRKVAPGPK